MTTATYIDIAESTIATATTSPTKAIPNDEAACYLYFTPIPGTAFIGINNNNNNNKNNMHAACRNALSAQNKKMTTPPTVPLEVALAAAHPDGSFDMEEIGVVVSTNCASRTYSSGRGTRSCWRREFARARAMATPLFGDGTENSGGIRRYEADL